MMDIYKMQYNDLSRYLVVINEITYVSVYEDEMYKIDQPFLSFQAKLNFFGKSQICEVTDFSGGLDDSNLDGNTIILQYEDSKYIYISGLEILEFRTDDKILEYLSLMGNNMIPYTSAVGEKYTFFISTHYKFIENDKIQEGMLINSSNDSLDPYDYHSSKSGLDCFNKLLECNRNQSFWVSMESGEMQDNVEDEQDGEEVVDIQELKYTNGSNEVVKIFNQKRVICLEWDI